LIGREHDDSVARAKPREQGFDRRSFGVEQGRLDAARAIQDDGQGHAVAHVSGRQLGAQHHRRARLWVLPIGLRRVQTCSILARARLDVDDEIGGGPKIGAVHGDETAIARSAVSGGDGGGRGGRCIDAGHEVTDQRGLAVTDERIAVLHELPGRGGTRRQPLHVTDLDLQLFAGSDVRERRAEPAVARPFEHVATRAKLGFFSISQRDLAAQARAVTLHREPRHERSRRKRDAVVAFHVAAARVEEGGLAAGGGKLAIDARAHVVGTDREWRASAAGRLGTVFDAAPQLSERTAGSPARGPRASETARPVVVGSFRRDLDGALHQARGFAGRDSSLLAVRASHRQLAVGGKSTDLRAPNLETHAAPADQHLHAAELEQRMGAARAREVGAALHELETIGGDEQAGLAVDDRSAAVVEPQAGAPVGVGHHPIAEREPPQPLHALTAHRHARVDGLQIRECAGQAAAGLVHRLAEQHQRERDREQQPHDRQGTCVSERALKDSFSHRAPPCRGDRSAGSEARPA